MKIILVLIFTAIILFSGCIGSEKTVIIGDNVSINYTGMFEDGKVFDTSDENVARENNLSVHKPLKFTVGKGQVIKGLEEGLIGMKVGDTRTLKIPPEKGYGQINPYMVRTIPILQEVPVTRSVSKFQEIPKIQFDRIFGPDHGINESVNIPETNINMTILNISTSVLLTYDLKPGDEVWSNGSSWNETVINIDDKNITLKANVSKDHVFQLTNYPWNTTVIGRDNVNITLRHNPIRDTTIPSIFGETKVSFNDTSIILDSNNELSGRTLLFNVTLVSIDK